MMVIEKPIFISRAIQGLNIDTVNRCYYIQFSDSKIKRTIEYNEDINIDIDAKRNVVGIEIIGNLKKRQSTFKEMAYRFKENKFELVPAQLKRELQVA